MPFAQAGICLRINNKGKGMRMNDKRPVRYFFIGLILLLGLIWSLSLASGAGEMAEYPNAQFIVSPEWLKLHTADEGVVILDVREDKYFDGNLIPGAIRLPWSEFRYDDIDLDIKEKFVGPEKAQQILGKHGIARSDAVVLYDSVQRDGGATASYVFWVLDILGHGKKMILDGGIDGWKQAGFDLAPVPTDRAPDLYQAPYEEIRMGVLVGGDYVYARLGDPMYQIIDVRSREEYLGEKGSADLRGNALKLGHIPTAVNVDYRSNWINEATKKLKSYSDLQTLYRGLDANRAVIVYCDSGRRASFTYFVMRVMGVQPVMAYEASWQQWGGPNYFYPTELVERRFSGDMLPGVSAATGGGSQAIPGSGSGSDASRSPGAQAPKGGYVSCGG